MKCSSCETKIENLFKKESSVKKIIYFSAKQSFQVNLKKNHNINDQKINLILKNAGYEALEIRRK